ncbi:diaminopimelate epimerase [Jeotgalibacillus proteolyticus]|uniref:Diaminopimelate epimerase n=1 Tax=Jeotgalibacillus proteolyticus TaxID=2082395 RepID=A0A2S5GFN7_9BACL|nr:diaminopimelate epimerase [Jeotgalibacillus proteolyticus]PPA71816.1 diaminopimelate epimerase [Jeotgalibacillus proteolyticus]
MKLSLIKCHGSSNDFIIFDEENSSLKLVDKDRAQIAETLCNRTSSIGADGVLYISESTNAQAKMRVFNSDGSEASMCGNGLRCAARYIAERDGLNKFSVETLKATLQVEKVESLYEDIPTYAVEISPILFNLDALPLEMDSETLINQPVPEWHHSLRFSALAVPNPHLITHVDAEVLSGSLQKEMAEKFNSQNEWFKDGVNVSFVVPFSENEIFVRTFERGVGFTNACGTAMSSSSLVEVILERSEAGIPIDVYNDGGRVKCVINKNEGRYDHIDLIGNATFTDYYEANIDEGSNQIVNTAHLSGTDEELIYQRMAQAAKEYLSSKLAAVNN